MTKKPLQQGSLDRQASHHSPLSGRVLLHHQPPLVQETRSPLVQPRLTIGQPNDKYEQEADRVADQVMRMPASVVPATRHGSGQGVIQRTCATCSNEYQSAEEENRPVEQDNLCPKCSLQTKQLAGPITSLVQREMDTRTEEDDEDKTLQAKPFIQRQADITEEEDEEQQTLQTSAATAQTSSATPGVTAGVNAMQGGGRPLSPATRSFIEPRFGHDFSRVRVHTDSNAARISKQINARAFTVGANIAFGAGQYQPHTPSGRKLLAHELTHVVQQSHVPNHVRQTSAAQSLSKAPTHAIQRKLIATGDANGFAALANSVIAVQHEVIVNRGGEISLQNTDVQGPPTPAAQVLVSTLQRVINNSGTTSIEFIHGTTSTRASDRRVLGGSFPQSKVDLDDEAILGTQESLGLGQGGTAGSVLAHEIEEQFRKQQLGQGFTEAHAGALAVEEQAVGAPRTSTRRVIPGGFEFTYTYNYPDGRVVVLKFDVINGNRTNIRRTVTP